MDNIGLTATLPRVERGLATTMEQECSAQLEFARPDDFANTDIVATGEGSAKIKDVKSQDRHHWYGTDG